MTNLLPIFASTSVLRSVILLLCPFVLSLAVPSGQAQTYTVLYTFKGAPDGAMPYSGVLQDPEGNLYGTTSVLYTFLNQQEGGYPNGDLTVAAAGNLYGTTYSGGDPVCDCGVVFKLTP